MQRRAQPHRACHAAPCQTGPDPALPRLPHPTVPCQATHTTPRLILLLQSVAHAHAEREHALELARLLEGQRQRTRAMDRALDAAALIPQDARLDAFTAARDDLGADVLTAIDRIRDKHRRDVAGGLLGDDEGHLADQLACTIDAL